MAPLSLTKQLFRDQLLNTELVTQLLETADNTGRYADRAIYGRGKMDLGAARSPVGILSVPVSGQQGGTALLQSTWSRTLSGGELRPGGVWSYRPGHTNAADPEVAVLAGWRWRF